MPVNPNPNPTAGLAKQWATDVAQQLLASKKANALGGGVVSVPALYLALTSYGVPAQNAALIAVAVGVMVSAYVIAQGWADKGKDTRQMEINASRRLQAFEVMFYGGIRDALSRGIAPLSMAERTQFLATAFPEFAEEVRKAYDVANAPVPAPQSAKTVEFPNPGQPS